MAAVITILVDLIFISVVYSIIPIISIIVNNNKEHFNLQTMSDILYFNFHSLNFNAINLHSQILVSDPECGTDLNESSNSLVADEYVSMWCVLEYRGHILTPVMVWRHSGHGWIIPAKEEVHPNYKVESRINVKVGLCENGATFSCTTYFSESDALNASGGMNIIFADNVPGYTYKWTSPMLKVTRE